MKSKVTLSGPERIVTSPTSLPRGTYFEATGGIVYLKTDQGSVRLEDGAFFGDHTNNISGVCAALRRTITIEPQMFP